jgi:hypothetical protein
LRSDYVVFTERIIFRQDCDAVHPVAHDGQSGRIDRRLGDTDVVGSRGKHSAHHVGVANKQLDLDVGPLFGEGRHHRRQQRYARHRVARNCQRSDLANADLLGNPAQIVDFRQRLFDLFAEGNGLRGRAHPVAGADEEGEADIGLKPCNLCAHRWLR